MNRYELERYLALTSTIERLEGELQQAVKEKQQLAQVLYERHGRHAVYRVGDQDLMVAPTKAGTYYFAPRVRWPKEARAAKAERKRLDRIARMQRPPIGRRGGMTSEAAADVLAGVVVAPERPETHEHPSVPGMVCRDPFCSVCDERMQEAFATPLNPDRVFDAYADKQQRALETLTPEELASVPVPTSEEIEAALEQGRRDREAASPARAARRIEITATLSRKATPEIDSSPGVPDGAHNVGEESHCEELANTLPSSSSVPASPQQPGGVEPSHDPSPGVEMSHTPGPISESLSAAKIHLPIVGDVNTEHQIEPRLLTIQEPRETESVSPSVRDVPGEHDQALEDLLAALGDR